MTFRKGKSKKRDAFFFDTCLIFPPFFSFNIIEKRKKGAISPLSQRKSIYLQTDLEYRIDMKKEKNFSETDFQKKKALESLSDDEILQGFKDADARIVREYYYGYCRVAYCIYDKRYDLQSKPGKDVAMQLGMTASAVTQRCQKMMHDVVIPYFKRYFDAAEYETSLSFCEEQETKNSTDRAYAASPMVYKSCIIASSKDNNNDNFNHYTNNYNSMENLKKDRITPQWINDLKENEIFVFGSNLAGMHGGGAARVARLRFGAVMGQGVGLQGQSYAIPTMQGGTETIQPYVDEFIAYARMNPDKHFLVTPIGCGIAGFEPEDIAPLFEEAKEVKNISLPESFWEVIE